MNNKSLSKLLSLCLSVSLMAGAKPAVAMGIDGRSLSGATQIPESEYALQDVQAGDQGDIILCVNDAAYTAVGEAGILLSGAEELMDTDEGRLLQIESRDHSNEYLINLFENVPGVLWAEPNQRSETVVPDVITELGAGQDEVLVPSGEDKSSEYNLTDLQYAYGTDPGGIDVPGWNDPANKNAEGTVVAVVDTGVDYNHPDLAPVMWDEGLNYPELVAMGGGKYGYNSGGDGPTDDPMPNNYAAADHGTHCAGIVAAAWNEYGVSGAANGAKIMAVRHSDDHSIETHATTLKAFKYISTAKKLGVNVVAASCSFGEFEHSQALTMGVEELAKQGIVTVMAAGNQTWDNDITSFTQSTSTHTPALLSVGNCIQDGSISDSSCYGIRTTDLFAPGTRIWSTISMAKSKYTEKQPAGNDAAGRRMEDDYLSESTYFHYEYDDTPGRIESHPSEEYKSSLTESFKGNGNDIQDFQFAKISLPEGAGRLKDTAFVNLAIKLEDYLPKTNSFVMLSARNSSGEFSYAEKDPNLKYYGYYDTDMGGWQCFNLGLPEDMDRENPVLNLEVEAMPGENKPLKVRLGAFRIVTAPYTYAYTTKTGTSMATPAVAGEVAIMASRWPEDSAEKRAARVLAGVKETENFKEICRMGGIANVRNSLDESLYRPVVNSVQAMANGKLHINGFFFGEVNADVSITQRGKTWEVGAPKGSSTGDGETLICDIPEGLAEGEIKVTVTNPVNHRSGSRILQTGPLGSKYRRIPLPSSAEFRSEWFHGTFTDGDRVWLLAKNDVNDAYETWIFDTQTLSFTPLYGDEAIPAGLYGNVAEYQGHLLFFDEEGDGKPARIVEEAAALSELAWYDKERRSVINRTTVRTSDGNTFPSGVNTLVADEDSLLCFSTPYRLNDDYAYYRDYGPSTLFRIDPVTGSAVKLLDLSASILPGTSIRLDKDGNIQTLGYVIRVGDRVGDAIVDYYRISLKKQNDSYTEEKTLLTMPENTELDVEIPSGFSGTDGIYLAGPVTTLSENGSRVSADNYYCPWDGTAFVKGAARISDARTYNVLTFGIGDNVYFFGETADSESGYVMACARLSEPVPEKEKPANDSILRKDLSKLVVGQQKFILSRSPYETGTEKVSFKSDNPKALAVNKGLVTAKKATDTPVSVTVTIKRGNEPPHTETIKLTVLDDNKPLNEKKDKTASLFVSKGSIKLCSGETLSINAGIRGSDYKNENRVLKARTSEGKLVSVTEGTAVTDDKKSSLSKSLQIKGLAPGTSWIALETYDKSLPAEKQIMNRKLIKVTVTAPATSLNVTGDSRGALSDGILTLNEGESDILYSLLNPLDCTEAAKLKWKAKGKGVSVKNGVITAKKASAVKNGALVPATVTVSCGTEKAEVQVYVTGK